MSESIRIRAAREEDSPALCTIYNQGIEDRLATLETDLRTPRERAQWLAGRSERTPVLVAIRAEEVLGFGSLNTFNPRACYRFVADFSIYVAREARGQGVGKALLARLERDARALGYHKLVLSAFPWNEAGLRLYHGAGFRTVGTYEEMGRLDDKWVDTLILEKLLS